MDCNNKEGLGGMNRPNDPDSQCSPLFVLVVELISQIPFSVCASFQISIVWYKW